VVDLWSKQNKLSHNCLSRDTLYLVLCVACLDIFANLWAWLCCGYHMPGSGQKELLRTKARIVREQRQRTLRRQRELLFPAANLSDDSDSETDPEGSGDICKPDPLSQYKRDLCLSVCCFLVLTIVVNLLVLQYILSRRI
jgi:hypothetical protein